MSPLRRISGGTRMQYLSLPGLPPQRLRFLPHRVPACLCTLTPSGEPMPAAEATAAPSPSPLPSATLLARQPTPTSALPVEQSTAQPTQRAPFDPTSWETLPVIPELSPRAREILAAGLARGNNPQVYSKIGDCESRTTWFLGNFDLGEGNYDLGPYADELAPVVTFYAGSHNRLSQAANQGFTAASLLSPLRADPKVCAKGENPLGCEYRLNRPAAAFIMLGTNDAVNPKTFEGHMRKIIETTLALDILPILGTKADNIEGDQQINQTIARLAYEYDLPLWNFWLAVQDLPSRGLQADGSHLTYAAPFFDDPAVLKKAWPVRNLNALQILKEVMDATQ